MIYLKYALKANAVLRLRTGASVVLKIWKTWSLIYGVIIAHTEILNISFRDM